MGAREDALRKINDGGFSKPMRITDSETGKVLRDDSDMMNTIKFSVAMGPNREDPKIAAQKAKEFFEKYYTLTKCPSCNQEARESYKAIYQVYHMQDPGSSGYDPDFARRDCWYCPHCKQRVMTINLPENEEEKNKILEIIKAHDIELELTEEDLKKYTFL